MNEAIICNNKIDTEKFNNRIKGYVIVSAEVFISSCVSESAFEVKISTPDLYEKISDFAFNHAVNYQELFQDDKYVYMSCFVYDVCQFKKQFEKEVLLKSFFENEVDHLMISFPDRPIPFKWWDLWSNGHKG
ncbi:hypothetical protein AB7W43_21460 [Providencia rettgeri]